MTTNALGRISRIAFATDMTRADAPVIPLGYILEGAWPNEARWLGMIGRTRLTRIELDAINLQSWKQLESPFEMLNKFFDKGWDAPWGEAGLTIQKEWARSSLDIITDDNSSALLALMADTSEAWTATCNALSVQLDAMRVHLAPTMTAPVVSMRRPMPIVTTPQPIESRTKTDIPPQAA